MGREISGIGMGNVCSSEMKQVKRSHTPSSEAKLKDKHQNVRS